MTVISYINKQNIYLIFILLTLSQNYSISDNGKGVTMNALWNGSLGMVRQSGRIRVAASMVSLAAEMVVVRPIRGDNVLRDT